MNGDTPQAPDGGNWQYKPKADAQQSNDAPSFEPPEPLAPAPEPIAVDNRPPAEVNWTASEFIAHEKNATWYGILVLVILVLVALAYFLFHDTVATVSITLLGVIFGMLASHKPRVLDYRIDATGVHIGPKVYPYAQFKSFGVVREDAFSNITLMPLRRFSPSLTIYYPPDEEETIVAAMADYLPVADVPHDPIDRFLRTIRF